MNQNQALDRRPQNAPAPAGQISRQELLTLVDTPEWRHDVGRAIVLSNSGLVPDTMRNNPAAVLSAFWVCDALGIERNPVNFAQLYSVHGKPGIMAQLMLGLAHAAGHKTNWLEQSDDRCAIEMDGQEFAFTIAQAKNAGMVGNDVWKKFPMDMLGWKVVSRAVRKVCPEVLLGLRAVAPDLLETPEVDDIPEAEVVEVSAATTVPDKPAAPDGPSQPVAGEVLVPPVSDETVAADHSDEPTITASVAKRELIAVAMEIGLEELEAKLLGSAVWQAYKLPDSKPVKAKTQEIMLVELRCRAEETLREKAREGGELPF